MMNIFIYLVDGLRYDRLPAEISKMGLTFKGIASGSSTRFSVPSIFTGVYPSTHGMRYSLDRIRGLTLFDLPMNTAFNSYSERREFDGEKSALYWWTNGQRVLTLEEMSPPFLFYEHNWQLHEYRKYVKDIGNPGQLKEAYSRGVKYSLETFKARIDFLKDKKLFEDTLIIFMADHGELLGEYGGLFTHNFPVSPELVYVPIVFINPEIEPKNVESGVARNVDIFPTILDVLNFDFNDFFFEGSSLFEGTKDFGICEYKDNWGDVWSIWTKKGGYVKIIRYRYPKMMLTSAYKMVKTFSFEPLKYFRQTRIYGEIEKFTGEKQLHSFIDNVEENKKNYMLNKIRLMKRKKKW